MKNINLKLEIDGQKERAIIKFEIDGKRYITTYNLNNFDKIIRLQHS